MKVVLFCGGLGTRLRDYSDQLPKPLVPIGSRPILWHLMRWYASYGHTEFILCLGHMGESIKKYFLTYDEALSNDFTFQGAGRQVELLKKDIDSWRITFIDTGLRANVGERLRMVRKYVEQDEVFMANYADGLTDIDCKAYVDNFLKSKKTASFLSVRVPQTFHIVNAEPDGLVNKMEYVGDSSLRINGGFFVFRREIFDYMQEGEELVIKPFERLIEKRQLVAVRHDGFWRSMDTFKDKIELDELVSRGPAPWQVWAR